MQPGPEGLAVEEHDPVSGVGEIPRLDFVQDPCDGLVAGVGPRKAHGDDSVEECHLPVDLLVEAGGDHMGGAVETGDLPGDLHGVAEDGDAGCLRVLGKAHGTGDHFQRLVGDLGKRGRGIRHRLGAAQDPVHGLDRLERELSARGLAGEHHHLGAFEDRVGHVGGFGAGGPRVALHGIQHLRGHDAELGVAVGKPHRALLQDGHGFDGTLDAQVATGDHDAVGEAHDLLQVGDGQGSLDLGDDGRVGPADFRQVIPHPLDVGAVSDEGDSHPVEALVAAEHQVALVLLGKHVESVVAFRRVHGLAGFEETARLHGGDDLLALHPVHRQLQVAVVQDDGLSRGHELVEGGMADSDLAGGRVAFGGDQVPGLPDLELVALGVRAHLRSAKIHDQGDGEAFLVGDLADLGDPGRVVAVGPVAEIQPAGGDTGLEELTQHFRRIGGRADGGEHFGSTEFHVLNDNLKTT